MRCSARRRPALAPPPAGLHAPKPTRLGDLFWLEPCPDALLEGLTDNTPGPEARYEAMEAISLAFVPPYSCCRPANAPLSSCAMYSDFPPARRHASSARPRNR